MDVVSSTSMLFHGDLSESLAAQYAAADRIAWDIETSGLNPKQDRIGTIQLHAPNVGSVVVQMGATVPRRACELLASDQVAKVFHHAMFDLRFMVAHWDVAPRNILCTKVASKLLTPANEKSHSLKFLLAQYLNITISKEQQTSNWLAPHLTSEQMRYAAGDVEYLLPLLDRLVADLQQAGRYELYRACADFLPARVQLDLAGWPDVFGY